MEDPRQSESPGPESPGPESHLPEAHRPDEVIPSSRAESVPAEPAPGKGEVLEVGISETMELIEGAKNGDPAALNELFSRHHGLMVDLARRKIGPRLRQKEDADDLAQTTFREATRDFGQYQYRGEGSFLRWLVRILQNKIRDKAEYYGASKRDSSRERSVEGTLGDSDEPRSYDPPSADLTVTQTIAREEEFKILREALVELSPDHRKAITLVFFEGRALREAGELMDGRSEDAVRMLLRRAESRLLELTRSRLAR